MLQCSELQYIGVYFQLLSNYVSCLLWIKTLGKFTSVLIYSEKVPNTFHVFRNDQILLEIGQWPTVILNSALKIITDMVATASDTMKFHIH